MAIKPITKDILIAIITLFRTCWTTAKIHSLNRSIWKRKICSLLTYFTTGLLFRLSITSNFRTFSYSINKFFCFFLSHSFPVIQKRLLTAAKELADATARMVEAAKSCASSPTDRDSQDALKRAAENLRNTTHLAVSLWTLESGHFWYMKSHYVAQLIFALKFFIKLGSKRSCRWKTRQNRADYYIFGCLNCYLWIRRDSQAH